jgi:integrase
MPMTRPVLGPMALAAFTGMRRGEILGLCWKDVDLANQRLYLSETKNSTLRVLALNSLAVLVLQGLPGGQPWELVFSGVDGANLRLDSERVFHNVGIKDASFYSLRHTAASWLVMELFGHDAVGRILGH